MLLRYAVLGVFAFLIDLGVTLAASRVMHYLIANSLGFIVANAVQFLVAHTWVFRRSLGEDTLLVTYGKTLGISLAGIAASDGMVFLMVAGVGLPLVGAKFVASGVVLALNFALRRAYVYTRDGP